MIQISTQILNEPGEEIASKDSLRAKFIYAHDFIWKLFVCETNVSASS